jgi:hypothetical protein
MESLLDVINGHTKNVFSEKKTLIVIGHTNEQFNKEDLVFFNGNDTFIVYYLINENNEVFFNDQRNFWFGVDWSKIIKNFNQILKN